MEIETEELTIDEIRAEAIINRVCEFFGVSREDLESKDRHQEIVKARQIIFYFLRRYTAITLKKIAKYFNRDHATVIHSTDTVEDLIKTDRYYRQDISTLQGEFVLLINSL